MLSTQLASPILAPARLLALASSLADLTRNLAFLGTRGVLGYSFLLTGRGKLRYFDNTVEYFTDLGIPFATANAGFVASLELVGGAALLLGVATRGFAGLLCSTMLVALITADGGTLLDALLQRDSVALSEVTSLVFLVLLSWLVAVGPGRLSLDAVVGPTLRARLGLPAR